MVFVGITANEKTPKLTDIPMNKEQNSKQIYHFIKFFKLWEVEIKIVELDF